MNRDQLRDRFLTMVPADEADRLLEWVDQYAAALTDQPAETWTAAETAVYLGSAGAAAARATLSCWGIKAVGTKPHPDSGRPLSLYSAEEIRAAHFNRNLKEATN